MVDDRGNWGSRGIENKHALIRFDGTNKRDRDGLRIMRRQLITLTVSVPFPPSVASWLRIRSRFMAWKHLGNTA